MQLAGAFSRCSGRVPLYTTAMLAQSGCSIF